MFNSDVLVFNLEEFLALFFFFNFHDIDIFEEYEEVIL